MRKILAIILICIMPFGVFGCFKTKSEEEYKNEYVDILNQINDRYGEYIKAEAWEFEQQVIIELIVLDVYINDENMRENMPAYKIIEDIRVILNDYLDANPNCRLAKQIQSKCGYIRMESVKEYFGSSQAISYFVLSTGYRDEITRFDWYDGIDIEWLDEMCSITRDNNEYNDYIENMYDYISHTGEDITSIVILEKKGLEDSEQEKWREEVRSKFPLMAATSE